MSKITKKTKPNAGFNLDLNKILQQIEEEQFGYDLNNLDHKGNINTVDVITFRQNYIKVDNTDAPYMDIILKMFYINTYGNERLELTDEEIELIKQIKNYNQHVDTDNVFNQEEEKEFAQEDDNINEDEYLDDLERQTLDMIENLSKEWGGNYWLGHQIENLKSSKRNPFRSVLLAVGRRSGKTFLASVIATYEVYKMLTIITCPKCKKHFIDKKSGSTCPLCNKETLINHPQSYYRLAGTEPLRVLLSATKKDQAVDPLLNYIKERIDGCPFFDGKFKFDDQDDSIYFRTEYDDAYNERMAASGQPAFKGSVRILTGGGNAKGQHGKGSVLTIFDEFALFNSEGVDTDKAVIEALVPASAQYRLMGDGRIVYLSMPNTKTGVFYNNYKKGTNLQSDSFKKILCFQMPTWEYRPLYTKQFIIDEFADDFGGDVTSAEFHRVFGAQFLDTAHDVYMPEIFLKKAVSTKITYLKDKPDTRKHNFFMHVDAGGTGNCNYAYAIGHWEFDHVRREKIFVEDRSFYWEKSEFYVGRYLGSDGKIYSIDSLNDEIIRVARIFGISRISFDNMQSEESKNKFRKNGFQLKLVTFSKYVKSKVYVMMEEHFLENRIRLCIDDYRMYQELKGLRRAPMKIKDRGIELTIDPDAEFQTMDLADCLGGVIYASHTEPMGKDRSIPIMAINTSANQFGSPMGMSMGAPNNRGGSIFGNTPIRLP